MRQLPIIVALAIVVPAAAVQAGDSLPPDFPYSACGTLVEDELYGCIAFQPLFGRHGPYLLDAWGDFKVGDQVHVSGTATYACVSPCYFYACVFGTEVTRCDKGTGGDLDGDGDVDGLDLALLLGQWGACPTRPNTCPADLDGSGIVNGLDLAILLAAWG